MNAAVQPQTQFQLFAPAEPAMAPYEEAYLLVLGGQSGAPRWFVEKARVWAQSEADILRQCLNHLPSSDDLAPGIVRDLTRIESALEVAA